MSSNHRAEFIKSAANSFLEYFEPEKCIENGEFYVSLHTLYPSDYYKRIVDRIIQYEKCGICILRGRKLSCSHRLCSNHFLDTCPICQKQITEQEKFQIDHLFCLSCFQVKKRSNFIGTLCAHQCSNCINLIIGPEFECNFCMVRLDLNIKVSTKACQYCDNICYKCHLISLDCEHFLCYNCLVTLDYHKKCPKCENSYFDESQIMTIEKFKETFKCETCNKKLETIENFCIGCNVNYCRNCENIHQLCNKSIASLYN